MSKYRDPAFTDPKDLQKKVDAYFKHCEDSKKVYELKNGDIKIRQEFPTVTGLAVWLHVHRDTLYSYMNEEYREDNDAVVTKQLSDTLIYARNRIAAELTQASMSGDADSKIASLLLNAMGETSPEVNATVNVVFQGDSEAYSR